MVITHLVCSLAQALELTSTSLRLITVNPRRFGSTNSQECSHQPQGAYNKVHVSLPSHTRTQHRLLHRHILLSLVLLAQHRSICVVQTRTRARKSSLSEAPRSPRSSSAQPFASRRHAAPDTHTRAAFPHAGIDVDKRAHPSGAVLVRDFRM